MLSTKKYYFMRIISTLILVLILGCSDGNIERQDHSEMSDSSMDMVVDAESYEENATPESDTQKEQKIIKSANLVFETNDVEATYQKILKQTSQYKGLLQSDNSGKDYNRIYKNLLVRIPTENFQAFLVGVSEGVPYFDQRNISQQDVSEEFIDLEARLKAKRELENRYIELLKKANTVKDMLEIERELSTIREEIEARQGRLQYLQNQVSMSTLDIRFYKTTAETGVTQSYGQKMKNALQGGWNGISVLFLGILYLWPLFFVSIIIVFLLRIFLKYRKSRKKPK